MLLVPASGTLKSTLVWATFHTSSSVKWYTVCVCDCITFTDIEFVLLLSNVLFHPRALPGVLLFRQNRGIVTELYWGGGGGATSSNVQ